MMYLAPFWFMGSSHACEHYHQPETGTKSKCQWIDMNRHETIHRVKLGTLYARRRKGQLLLATWLNQSHFEWKYKIQKKVFTISTYTKLRSRQNSQQSKEHTGAPLRGWEPHQPLPQGPSQPVSPCFLVTQRPWSRMLTCQRRCDRTRRICYSGTGDT